MIAHLRIGNVALIDEVEVSFGNGLNVLTGETGAGKSIVVDSILFLLGERPGKDFIRMGAETALVEGIFEIETDALSGMLKALNVEGLDDGQLFIERTQTAKKTVCKVNGRTVTVGMLKEISALLADVHGQHEHQSLLDTDKQLALLDQFCGAALEGHKRRLEHVLHLYRENGKKLRQLIGNENQRQSQTEMWQYQLDEIEKARLKPGEEDELILKRNRLSQYEALNAAADAALSLLADGENPAVDALGQAVPFLQKIEKTEPQTNLAGRLTEGFTQVNDVVSELRHYSEGLDADPNELERVENRLDTLYRLKKKYGATVEAILKHRDELSQKMESLLNSAEEIKKLKIKKRELTNEITGVCGVMAALRKKHAETAQESIQEVLRDLGMADARFEIALAAKTVFGPEGNDRAEFLIAPNPGEPMKPLNRIASGGEMSRVMLAIKSVLAEADRIGCVIFDEVDAGVSGRTAQMVSEKLMGIGRSRQILCITHLPQIAAMADSHFLIEKNTLNERTITSVKALDNKAIISELARLIGGAEITEATLNAAGEMKQQADELKKL